jgi:2-dehydropantoate 2-reductase
LHKRKLKIGIIGAGSIGSLFGGYLANIDSDDFLLQVTFFGRKKHIDEINKYGLKIYQEKESIYIKNIIAYEDSINIEEYISKNSKKYFDFIFLSTKTYDLEVALKQYKELIHLSRYIVILENGIGNEELVKNYVSKKKIIRIVTSHGALLKDPGEVYHTGAGFTNIGFAFLGLKNKEDPQYSSSFKDLEILKKILDLGGIKTKIVDDIIQASWEKAFVNIAINALGALTRLHNGALLEHEGLKVIMKDAIIEAVKVAELKKIRLSKTNYVELAYSVAEKTYNNKNSMLQDILRGKKTEIDFFNGRIVNFAKELGMIVPINEILTNLIKGLESSFF